MTADCNTFHTTSNFLSFGKILKQEVAKKLQKVLDYNNALYSVQKGPEKRSFTDDMLLL